MKLLQIDTAASLCAACVFDCATGLVMQAVSRDIGTGHAEQLIDVIDEVLCRASLGYQDLGRIGVVVGPGSFTGVRVGVATARGLALALSLDAIGVSTLMALAVEAAGDQDVERVASVIDARREQFYSAVYDRSGREIAAPTVADASRTIARVAEAQALTGSGARALGLDMSILDEKATARIATYARLASTLPSGNRPTPLYLRGADAKTQAGFILPGRA